MRAIENPGVTATDFRRFPRLTVDLTVFRRQGEGFVTERAVNICRGGVAVATRELLVPGSMVDLVLTAPDGYVEVPVQCQVTHTVTSPFGAPYLAGLRVTHVDLGVFEAFESLLLRLMVTPEGQRLMRRVEVHVGADWRDEANPSAPAAVQVLNLGFGGALIRAPSVPPPGSRGFIAVHEVVDGQVAGVPATVVWSRREAHADLAGLHFQANAEARAFVAGMLRHFLFRPRDVATPGAAPRAMKVAGFEVGDLIGRGGMCDVYRGRGLEGPLAGRTVALKRLRPQAASRPGVADRFVTESDLGRMLVHPGVVRVYTAAEFGDEHWMAMELVEGESVARLLAAFARQGKRAPQPAVLSLGVELLETLHYCHTFRSASGRLLEIVHGDVSPANVLISREGAVKLTDFGVASTALPEVSDLRGIPNLAPELCLKKAKPTPAVDVFQTGALLYEALTGVRPFKARTPEELLQVVERGPVAPGRINPDIAAPVERVILAALSANPRKRPASARMFAEVLLAAPLVPRGAAAASARAALFGMPAERLPTPAP